MNSRSDDSPNRSGNARQNSRGSAEPRHQTSNTPGPDDDKKTELGPKRPLDAEHRTWLQDARGIDPEVATNVGCYSATLSFASGSTAPAFVTPCIIEDRQVSWQARFDMRGRPMKGFVSGEDARKHLFFAQQVWEQDYHLCDFRAMKPLKEEDPSRVVVIHEGQLDALAGRMAGFVGVSLPNGTKSMEWIEQWAPKLANCRRVVVWLDADEPGTKAYDATEAAVQLLKKELWGNVYFVHDPSRKGERIKDANDALLKGGVELVREIVLGARTKSGGQYNVKMTRLDHHVTQFKTGLDWLDSRLVLCAGEHSAIIGRTNRGKSKFSNYLSYLAAKNNGEKVYYQSFETVADGELSADLAEIEMQMPIERILADPKLYEQALDRIQKHVTAAEPSLVPKTKDPFGACIGRIVEQAMEGVRIHVIDNYAMVQTVGRGTNENNQTREDIIELNEVCRRYDIAAIVVYHARKGDPRFTQKNMPPEIEDAAGSGAIGNHCCLAVSVERVMENDADSPMTNLAVRKARRKTHGRRCNFAAFWEPEVSGFDFLREGFYGIDVAREKKNKGSSHAPSALDDDTGGLL